MRTSSNPINEWLNDIKIALHHKVYISVHMISYVHKFKGTKCDVRLVNKDSPIWFWIVVYRCLPVYCLSHCSYSNHFRNVVFKFGQSVMLSKMWSAFCIYVCYALFGKVNMCHRSKNHYYLYGEFISDPVFSTVITFIKEEAQICRHDQIMSIYQQ